MVKIEVLITEGKLSKISDLELDRYINFFESSYKENLECSKFTMIKFARWSIISGYYAMHDITKLLLAKKFSLKIEFEVHATAIKALRELIKNKKLLDMIEEGHKQFISLANDLAEGKKERVKAQYYTGTEYMKQEYIKRAKEFHEETVKNYLEAINKLL